jgi:hypothetical protein
MSLNMLLSKALTISSFLLSIPTTGIILVLGLIYMIYIREFSPLQSIPGPFLASITKLWLVQQQRSYQRPKVDMDLHKKYGPIVRIAPNEVLVSDPQSFKTIYGILSRLRDASREDI